MHRMASVFGKKKQTKLLKLAQGIQCFIQKKCNRYCYSLSLFLRNLRNCTQSVFS